MRQHLIAAGFKFAPPEACAFTAVGGVMRGHADGIIIHGPDLLGAYVIYPLIWEHNVSRPRPTVRSSVTGSRRNTPIISYRSRFTRRI